MDTQPATCRCGTGPKSGLKLTGVKARSFATNPEMLSTIRGTARCAHQPPFGGLILATSYEIVISITHGIRRPIAYH